MKHIQLRALTLTFTLLMAAFAAQHASARPNWPDYEALKRSRRSPAIFGGPVFPPQK